MSVSILLNSSNFDGNNKMVYNFPNSVNFTNKEICLVNASFYNCFFNISSALGNNQIHVYMPEFTGPDAYTMVKYTKTFDDGFYSIEDINASLQNFFILNDLYLQDSTTDENLYFITFLTNNVNYSFQLNTYYLPTQSQADGLNLNAGFYSKLNPFGNLQVSPQVEINNNLSKLLGFPIAFYPSNVLTYTNATYDNSPAYIYTGVNAPQINPSHAVILRCNLVNNNNFSIPNDLLSMIPVTESFGSINQYSANIPVYVNIQNANYNSIEISFYNQDLSPQFFRDGEITLNLHIKDRK